MNTQNKALSLLLFVGLLLTGCSSNNSNPSTSGSISTSTSGEVPEISHKTIKVNISSEDAINVEAYFFNKNIEVPYLEISETVNKLFDLNTFSISKSGNVFTLKNKKTDTSITINVDGNVTYQDYSRFTSLFVKADGCYIDDFASDTLTCQKLTAKSSYSKATEYKLDLSKFGFKPILHESNYYLPINVMHKLISIDLGEFYYASNGEIYALDPDKKTTCPAKATYQNPKGFFEYCFNEFALTTELHFGLKGYSRTLRYNSKELKYMPNGVVETFAPYKEKIINSKDLAEFDNNMVAMISDTMSDGGHTTLYDPSFGNTSIKTLPYTPEENFLNQYKEQGTEIRKTCADKASYDYLTYTYDTDDDGKGDIGYVTFDKFNTDEKEKDPTIQSIFRGPEGANATLNKYDTDNYDSKNYDIKDVIIDISLNGGGDVNALAYVLSWICGGVAQETLKGCNGKIESTYAYNFDVNGDGVYDHKDYLGEDVNVYILVSPYTYSAANSLAYNSKQYNLRNPSARQINIIGLQSGGGACSVTKTCYLPSGFSYRLSYNNVSVDPNNTSVCNENGVTPEKDFLFANFTDIFNRSGSNGINQFVKSRRK